jgi:hypothetical protein
MEVLTLNSLSKGVVLLVLFNPSHQRPNSLLLYAIMVPRVP